MNLAHKYRLSNVRRTLWAKHKDKMKKMAMRGTVNNQKKREEYTKNLRIWANNFIKTPLPYTELLKLLKKQLPEYKTNSGKIKKYSSLIRLMTVKGIIRYDWDQEGYVCVPVELPRF